MPPLPLNGSSYPPSSSGYAPLDREDELEPSFPCSSVTRRTFTHSPYRSRANDPTDLLQTFLSDTRPHAEHAKALSLRITLGRSGKRIELPLPKLTVQDALPFAVADDVPCLRGLPSAGTRGWGDAVRGLIGELTGSTPRHAREGALQVWNASQKRPLYATSEEVDRSHTRFATGTIPPWTSVNDDFLPAPPTVPAPTEEQQGQDDVDKLFDASSGMGDFDLASVFAKTRQRKTSWLVSGGLQEAMECFADDRHFSKRLRCREAVWGWDLVKLRRSVREIARDGGKGKGRQQDSEEEELEVEVVGLEDGPVYHVVWAPIPYLATRWRGMFETRGALIAIVITSTLFVGSILLGMISNTLFLIVTLLSLLTWGMLMRLVRTQHRCVYDTIGTAWCLSPRWIKLVHVDPSWEHAAVMDSLGESAAQAKIASRDDGWYIERGVDQDDWLTSHRDRLVHWCTT
ncbi:hypothetical protein PSEUBRA_002898 [Kalmanozyma brasiliensis GHG001]|uniref:uncharacterized protein n=1 Tax=Kalmanozyma brasiliensis (strain GHG001) TaxID=1365824 RepID=UPI002867C597|nr:uncharacterized protein PSEUBRA_002898 [Kalmanozyma brasiliensis GHG001]KAF6767151.1 hypothetical protein PSEUBRA_002898 [Kalmanozyma brasiliensis GHG001]